VSAPAFEVGFLGVGHMGRPMVARLAAEGWRPRVYVRRPELAAELAAEGLDMADTPTELAASVDLLIVCLFSDEQLRSLLLDDGTLSAMRPGSVVATHVTGSPDLVVELADSAPEGVSVLDMPISGGPAEIEAGRLTILAGGAEEVIERVRPAFATYADPIISVGGLGDAMRVKLVNNLLFTANLRMALDAAKLAASMGVNGSDLARVLKHCSGDSFALRTFEHREPDPTASGARPYLMKDVAVVREVAEAMGLDLGELGEVASWVYEPTGEQE
jgi:3-hydroxyisobutyrate dehydrogenase-like beta-hydroxyacid dehydrogenase